MPIAKVLCAVLSMSMAAPSLAAAIERSVPKPLAEHPGNIFLAGEEIVVESPAIEGNADAWRVIDYEGKLVAEGRGVGKISLGRLPVGHYDVRRMGADRAKAASISLGVLEPLRAPTPLTSPIDCDVAMALFYPEAQMPAVASLCTLAGFNWVRDRLKWPEVENQKGVFATKTRYDASASVQAAADLQVLQVNHFSPAWASSEPVRFPIDLRDAYRFYREIAKRWQGKVLAIEPWNEADIAMFGGQTGSEMASLQKASYLGIKAGNPETIVCQNVFALSQAAILKDFHANRAWPYFDTFNLHHYDPVERYPELYADFRAVSAGRPLWVSECNMPVTWAGDPKRAEPSEADLRVQAERVAKVYAASLHEGSAATFFFILGHCVAGQTQYGIIRPDLTPRPAFVAMAAVGRLLADAKPLGRMKTDEDLAGFLFLAKPDGNERLVLVAWSRAKNADPAGNAMLTLPAVPEAVFDHLGRAMAMPGNTQTVSVSLLAAPLLAVFPADAATKFDVEPPPAAAPMLEGKPTTVVLQATWPRTEVAPDRSAYRVSRERTERIPIFVYNFGSDPVEGRLALKGPKDWTLSVSESVKIPPDERVEIGLNADLRGAGPEDVETVVIEGDFGSGGEAVLSLSLTPISAENSQ